jgi:hypothetical protein
MLCLWVKDIAVNNDLVKFITYLKKLTDLEVVLIGELSESENIGERYKTLCGSARLILTSHSINSFVVSDQTTRNSTKRGKRTSKHFRGNDIVEIVVPDCLSASEHKKFINEFLHRKVCVPNRYPDGLPDKFFVFGKRLHIDEILQDVELKHILQSTSDHDLEKNGFSPNEVRQWKERVGGHCSSTSAPAETFASETFWSLLLLDPTYKKNVLQIMSAKYDAMVVHEQRLIQLIMFYGLFSPDHGVPTEVATLILSQFSATSLLEPLKLSPPLSAFLKQNPEFGVVEFRSHIMTYAWKEILFDRHKNIFRSNYLKTHFTELWGPDKRHRKALANNRALLQAVLNFMGDYAIWSCLEPPARLTSANLYSIRGGVFQLQYSFLIEFMFGGKDFEGYSSVAELYEYIVQNVLNSSDMLKEDIDAEMSFKLNICTRYAKVLTSRAEAKCDTRLLEQAREILDSLSPSIENHTVFERKGAIERAYLRIILKTLKSLITNSQQQQQQQSNQQNWNKVLVNMRSTMFARAEAAEKWYRKAMVYTGFSTPNPKVSVMQMWLTVLDILRWAFCNKDYSLCFDRIKTPIADERTNAMELFATARSYWIFNRLADQSISISCNMKYRSADTSNRWNEKKTRQLVKECKEEQCKYEELAWNAVHKADVLNGPYEYWIARDLWKDKNDCVKFKYSIIAANNKINSCFNVDSKSVGDSIMSEQLFLALELLFKIATSSHGCPGDTILLPRPDQSEICDYVWSNTEQFSLCLENWLKAVRKPDPVLSESNLNGTVSRQLYYGLTPYFGMCSNLVAVCLSPRAVLFDKDKASSKLAILVNNQREVRDNLQYNFISRYMIAEVPKIAGVRGAEIDSAYLSFSVLIKVDIKNAQYTRRSGSISYHVFTGTIDGKKILCKELSHGTGEIFIRIPNEYSYLEGTTDPVTFYLGVSGYGFNVHELKSDGSRKS